MTYPNAPIYEAIFDIKVDSVKNVDVDSYEKLIDSDLSEFSKTERKVVVSGQLKFDRNKESEFSGKSNRKVLGTIFSSDDLNYKVQFRKDGFTFNMLKQYSNWEDFSAKAFNYWQIYQKHVEPKAIKRIALRYINKIHLPLQNLRFEDYLHNIPELPDVFEDAYSSMFFKMSSKCKNSDNNAIIIRTFEQPSKNDLPFILDIDVYKQDRVDVLDLKNEFETIRNDKNRIFESLITDKTRSLFK